MIPKVIHYCWFGRNPLPEEAKKCIASWQKFMPDYEIKEWNEDNFDVNIIAYTKEAYQEKKYAFVSDYARFWILYHYGGIYFDTDVEIIKPIDDIINRGAFMGCENEKRTTTYSQTVAPGLGLGCEPNHQFYKNMLEIYSEIHFINIDGSLNLKTIVSYTSELLTQKGMEHKKNTIQFVDNIWIYPKDFFCPIDYHTGKKTITNNTRTIHHYSESWKSPKDIYKLKIKRMIGSNITNLIIKLKTKICKKWLSR